MKEYCGNYSAEGYCFGIVVARFNEVISRHLLEGAIDCLRRHGVDPEDIKIAWVPGSAEIPLIAQHMALSSQFDAVICLGAIIRGATDHYEYVASQVSMGVSTVSLECGVPVIFGVLTTDNLEQALERAGSKSGNKGFDAALAAIEMVNLENDLLEDIYSDMADDINFDDDQEMDDMHEIENEPAMKNGKKI